MCSSYSPSHPVFDIHIKLHQNVHRSSDLSSQVYRKSSSEYGVRIRSLPSDQQKTSSCLKIIKPFSLASKARNLQQSTLTRLTLSFLRDACGSVIQAPNLVPEVFTVSGPVIFISLPHAANTSHSCGHTRHKNSTG